MSCIRGEREVRNSEVAPIDEDEVSINLADQARSRLEEDRAKAYEQMAEPKTAPAPEKRGKDRQKVDIDAAASAF